MKDITKILGVSRKTIHNWLVSWEERSLIGLYDKKGRSRKPTLSKSQKSQICLWVKQSHKQLEKVRSRIEREWELKFAKRQ
ncbi:helix-turn-helix domain-containing protein [Calothrix rhizosoleniae]|uniref:helix-turn-helix domain-containing protein n=1 Tax=Calothrix rhizosoleniae TaxID=888997 RepID=UPI001F26D6D0|nr:helix-turn-helix domain-containing protein [Calothrix rhizosoleniae]